MEVFAAFVRRVSFDAFVGIVPIAVTYEPIDDGSSMRKEMIAVKGFFRGETIEEIEKPRGQHVDASEKGVEGLDQVPEAIADDGQVEMISEFIGRWFSDVDCFESQAGKTASAGTDGGW